MALPLGKITLLVGAGILGSVLANREGGMSNVSDLFSGAFKIALRQIQRDDSRSSSNKPRNDSLVAQVNSLKQELQLLASNRPVTIITGSSSGRRNIGVPVVVVVIIVGYGYIWWKGWKLSDMMFATRRGLTDACSSVGKQLDQVSSSISTAKRHLSSRIDRVDCNIDESAELTSATKNEVLELRGDLRTFTVDVESVHRAVQTLETKISRIEGKQDMTTNGVHVLCNFVESLENSKTAASIQGASSRRALEPPQLTPSRIISLQPNAVSLEPPSPSSSNESPKVTRYASGFKEIEIFSETLKAMDNSEVPNGDSPADDPKSNGSSNSNRFGWKFPILSAPFLSRTHSATTSFK